MLFSHVLPLPLPFPSPSCLFLSLNSRAKEQTEAREQYFADLKQQFDEMRVSFDRDLNQVSFTTATTTATATTRKVRILNAMLSAELQ